MLVGGSHGDLAPPGMRGSSLKSFSYESKIASAHVKSATISATLSAEGACQSSEPEMSRDHTERML